MLVFLTILVAVEAAHARSKCVDVDPTPSYNMNTFKGNWKEIGKIQTAGGAVWQEGCVCNSMDFTPDPTSDKGDAHVSYQCNDQHPAGDIRQFGGKLEATSKPGQFKQVMFEGMPKVDWTVLVEESDYAMTYDCVATFSGFVTNYCIHIMSRSSTLDQAIVDKLLRQVETLGLNPDKISYESINQKGCQ